MSKKHIMAVEALRRELELEEQAISQHATPVEEEVEEKEEVKEEVREEEEVKEEEKEGEVKEQDKTEKESETEKPSKKKNKRQKRRVIEVNTSIPEETVEEGEMSVLEMIEKMNNQNMTGRKAKNMNRNDDMPSKKKGKKGKNK